MNHRSDWLFDVEQETTALSLVAGIFDGLQASDQLVFIDHMRESAAKLTRLLENAEQCEQPKEEALA